MPELRMRMLALVAILIAASTRIGLAPFPELSAELAALHAQAGQGEAEAQVSLGFKYRRGEGVLQSDVAAARWFRAAAEQDHAAAQFNLGFHYREGRGVPQDDGLAIRWYRLAADQGDADAQNNLGGMYARGNGVEPNGAEAVLWWTRAAEQRHAMAQYNLGFMYGDGLDLPPGPEDALRAPDTAARGGPAMAADGPGPASHDTQTVPQDYVRAHMWLTLASRHSSGAVREGAIQGRARAEQKMSAAEVAEARRRAREWRPASAAN